jgi:hypothetical protein
MAGRARRSSTGQSTRRRAPFRSGEGGHVSASVTETVYRHEIRPALTKDAAAMDVIFKQTPDSA